MPSRFSTDYRNLRPYVLEDVRAIVSAGSAGSNAAAALTAHRLNDTTYHLGQLDPSQATWALTTSAGDARYITSARQVIAGAGLTGGGTLAGDVTIDVNPGAGLAVSADAVILASTVAGAGLTYSTGVLAVGAGDGISVAADAVALASTVAGNGLTYTTGVINVGAGAGITVAADSVALTTPGTLTITSTNVATGNHTHAITSSSNPGAAASLLASDSGGALTLTTLTASTKVRTPLLDTASGALTLQPATDVLLTPGSGLVKASSNVALQASNFASQATGWRVTYDGQADFRYLFVDEMHAKSVIADLEQALAGGQIICKSVSVLAAAFTVPAANTSVSNGLRVRDLPSAPGMAVFQSGDIVRLRTFARSAGSLTIGDCWGVVTSYTDQGDGTQTWTFSRSASPNAGGMAAGTVIQPDAIILDYGTTGNGFYEVNAIDGAYGVNSPYAQTVTWTTHPATGQTVRTRLGNLKGIFSVSNEFGLYAGTGTADNDTYLRLSSDATNGNRLNNLAMRFFSSGSELLRIDSVTGLRFRDGNAVQNKIEWASDFNPLTSPYMEIYTQPAVSTSQLTIAARSPNGSYSGTIWFTAADAGTATLTINALITPGGNNQTVFRGDKTDFAKDIYVNSNLVYHAGNDSTLAKWTSSATWTTRQVFNGGLTLGNYKIYADGEVQFRNTADSANQGMRAKYLYSVDSIWYATTTHQFRDASSGNYNAIRSLAAYVESTTNPGASTGALAIWFDGTNLRATLPGGTTKTITWT